MSSQDPDTRPAPRDEAAQRPSAVPKRWLLAAGLVLVLGLVGLALGVRAAWGWLWETYIHRTEEIVWFTPTAAHHDALFTYADLLRASPELPPPNAEERNHAQDEWRGWYLNHDEGVMSLPGTAVSCALDIQTDRGLLEVAEIRYRSWWRMAGFNDGRRTQPTLTVESVPFAWGDDAACGVLFDGDEAIGNTLVVRKGVRTVWLEWRGLALRESDALEELIVPSLEEMMALER